MKLSSAVCILAIAASAGISRAQTPAKSDSLTQFAALFQEHPQPEDTGPALSLDEVEQIALARNPEIEVAVRREPSGARQAGAAHKYRAI